MKDPIKILSKDTLRDLRIPPNQRITKKFPIMTYGETPSVRTEDWKLECFGDVASRLVITWQELLEMPRVEVVADFHCVTRWSRLNNVWEGVSLLELLNRIELKSTVTHVTQHCYGGYTTNVSLDALKAEDALLAFRHDGRPLEPDHGGPVRMVLPKLYAWKSAKWVSGLEFLSSDRPGFWERNGYHNQGDPWREERYSDG